MDLYKVPLSVSMLGFEIGTMLANFHVVRYYIFGRAVLNILARNGIPKRAYVFLGV